MRQNTGQKNLEFGYFSRREQFRAKNFIKTIGRNAVQISGGTSSETAIHKSFSKYTLLFIGNGFFQLSLNVA